MSLPAGSDEVEDVANDKHQDHDVTVEQTILERRHYALLLILTGWVSSLANGVLLSVQSYSCLPYGIQVCHLSFARLRTRGVESLKYHF